MRPSPEHPCPSPVTRMHYEVLAAGWRGGANFGDFLGKFWPSRLPMKLAVGFFDFRTTRVFSRPLCQELRGDTTPVQPRYSVAFNFNHDGRCQIVSLVFGYHNARSPNAMSEFSPNSFARCPHRLEVAADVMNKFPL